MADHKKKNKGIALLIVAVLLLIALASGLVPLPPDFVDTLKTPPEKEQRIIPLPPG